MRIASILALSLAALSPAQTACRGVPAPGAPGLDARSGARRDVLGGVRAISAGREHTCAVTTEGTVVCWGDDILGTLGTGAGQCQSSPNVVPAIRDATAIAAGDDFTCALTRDGAVWCWGGNSFGQLGDGSPAGKLQSGSRSSVPVRVKGLSAVTDIAAGDGFACALTADHSVACWGRDGSGELGDGATASPDLASPVPDRCHSVPCSASPVRVKGLTAATAIDAGDVYACALLADGTVTCWGDHTFGLARVGSATFAPAPAPVRGLSDVRAISAGAGAVCALVSDGSVACWGSSAWMGEVANGPLPEFSAHRRRTSNLAPETVSLLSGVRAIAAGGQHVCALLADTTVECWGSNNRGQLGRPPEEIEEHCSGFPCLRTPRSVPGLDGVVRLSAGAAHTCAQMADGSTQCWGDHTFGQLGRACPIVARIVDQDRPAACGQELSFCADPAPVWPLPLTHE